MTRRGRVVLGVSEQLMQQSPEYAEREATAKLDVMGRKAGLHRTGSPRLIGKVDPPENCPDLPDGCNYVAYEADFA